MFSNIIFNLFLTSITVLSSFIFISYNNKYDKLFIVQKNLKNKIKKIKKNINNLNNNNLFGKIINAIPSFNDEQINEILTHCSYKIFIPIWYTKSQLTKKIPITNWNSLIKDCNLSHELNDNVLEYIQNNYLELSDLDSSNNYLNDDEISNNDYQLDDNISNNDYDNYDNNYDNYDNDDDEDNDDEDNDDEYNDNDDDDDDDDDDDIKNVLLMKNYSKTDLEDLVNYEMSNNEWKNLLENTELLETLKNDINYTIYQWYHSNRIVI